MPKCVLALLTGPHGVSPAALGDGCGESRYTPLMAAARWGHADCVELLLAHGAEAGRETQAGESIAV